MPFPIPGPGRPSEYTTEMGEAICEAISSDARSVRTIIAESDVFPDYVTVWKWRNRHPDFAAMYDAAQERRADTQLEAALEIADDEPADGDTQASVGRAKLRVETRMRVVPLLNRSKYGQKVAVTGGDEKDAPLRFDNVTDRERAKALALLVAKAKANTGE